MTPEQQAKVHATDVWLHDMADTKYLQRRAVAASYGFDPDTYVRPFPGTTSNVNVNKGTDWSKSISTVLLATAIGGGSLGLAGMFAVLAGRPPAAPIIVAPAVPQARAESADSKVRLQVLWRGKEIEPGSGAEAKVSE